MSYQLTDSFGRTINNLRVSVTDQCNFRCIYCMPEEGMIFQPREEILTFEEITRFVGIVTGLGISKLRLTGGEPTVRKGPAGYWCACSPRRLASRTWP